LKKKTSFLPSLLPLPSPFFPSFPFSATQPPRTSKDHRERLKKRKKRKRRSGFKKTKKEITKKKNKKKLCDVISRPPRFHPTPFHLKPKKTSLCDTPVNPFMIGISPKPQHAFPCQKQCQKSAFSHSTSTNSVFCTEHNNFR